MENVQKLENKQVLETSKKKLSLKKLSDDEMKNLSGGRGVRVALCG